jgi:hypothetical protein
LSKGIVGATTTYPADAHRLSKLAYMAGVASKP